MHCLWPALRTFKYCFPFHRLCGRPRHRGKNVDVYVIDTGVSKLPVAFGHRVRWKKNYTTQDWTDTADHGTRMASVIGSNKFGVSTESKLCVNKIDEGGQPDLKHLAKALQDVAERHERRKKSSRYRGAVINLSLSIDRMDDTEDVRTLLDSMEERGIPVVMAAGNEERDLKDLACNNLCKCAQSLITVGAVDKYDRLADYGKGQGSNWWQHLTIFAPGKDIDGIDANGAHVNDIQGTSPACAYVTGIVAILMSGEKRGCSVARVKKLLVLNARRGKIYCLSHRKGPNLVADHEFPQARDGPWLGYRRSDADLDETIREQENR